MTCWARPSSGAWWECRPFTLSDRLPERDGVAGESGPALDEAAENLGAGWWKRLFRITPLVPGDLRGSDDRFHLAFTELGTPLMFDYYSVTSVQIYYGLKQVETSAEPYALT